MNMIKLNIIAAFACLLMLIMPATALWQFDGWEVKTMETGSINGDVFISFGDRSGLLPSPYTSNFTLPGGAAKYSRLYVGVWGGTETRTGWVNTTLNGATIGNVTINGTGDTNPTYTAGTNVYGRGNGVWWASYNVTGRVNMGAINTATARTGGGIDGRVYAIVLVTVYIDASKPEIQYWINEGSVNLHYASASYPYVQDKTFVWFNGTAITPASARLNAVYLTSSQGEPDYLYFNPPDAVDSPYSNMSWDINAYRTYQLNGDDVADASNGGYFDFEIFTSTNDSTALKNIVNTGSNNYAVFWRGHDDNNDGTIYAEFTPTIPIEGESYVGPVLSALVLEAAPVNYTYVTTYTPANGTVTNFANMQSAADGGAFATLTATTITSNRTKNPGKTITSGTQDDTYTPSHLDTIDGQTDVTIPASTLTSVIKHASANPTMDLGIISSGSYSNTLTSDNSYLNLAETGGSPDAKGKLDSKWEGWEAVTEVSNSSIVEMNISIEAYVADGEAVYIQLWDFPIGAWNGTWRQLGTSGLPATDTGAVYWHNITSTSDIQRFVNLTGNYKIRLDCAKAASLGTDTVASTFYIDEFKVAFKYNLYSLNVSYTFTETNSSAAWQSISIRDSSYGDPLGNVSILNATGGKWESILTSAFTGGTSPVEHVNVIKGASGSASSYDAGGGQIKLRYNWTNSTFNNNLGVDLINVTVYINNTSLLNITTDTIAVPADTNYYLQIKYSRDASDAYNVYAFNGTAWNLKGSLDLPAWSVFNTTIDSSEVINGNVSVRYLDKNTTGSTQGNLYIDYQRIRGFTSGAGVPDVSVTQNNVSFGNITRGGTREIIASLTLNNTGTAAASIVAKFINSSGATYGLTNATINVIGGSNFSIGLNGSEQKLSDADALTFISTLAAGDTVSYDAILIVPADQVEGDYAGTVQITWS